MGKQRIWLAGLMVVVGAVALYRGRLRPWMYTWCADDDELAATLPGDELVSANTPTTTRAVTIAAPIADVWPWLTQIGEDRGGFYLREQSGQTRPIVRGSSGAVGHAGFDIPHFVVEQKMMRGIRERAEQLRRVEVVPVLKDRYRADSHAGSLVK